MFEQFILLATIHCTNAQDFLPNYKTPMHQCIEVVSECLMDEGVDKYCLSLSNLSERIDEYYEESKDCGFNI